MCSLVVLLIAALFVCNAKAYWSGSVGTKHEEVANAVLDYPTMQYYKAALIAQGYSISSIVSTADSEPSPHNGWSWISNPSKLSTAALSNYNIGMILHAAADGSVGSKHEPAILETDLGHTIWEQTAEALTMPAMSYYSDVRVGSFDTKMDDIYADFKNRSKSAKTILY